MCTLPLLAGENIGTAFVVPTVAASVDLVVHVGTDVDGRRRVREIVALPGRAEAGVIETADVFTTRDGRLPPGTGIRRTRSSPQLGAGSPDRCQLSTGRLIGAPWTGAVPYRPSRWGSRSTSRGVGAERSRRGRRRGP